MQEGRKKWFLPIWLGKVDTILGTKILFEVFIISCFIFSPETVIYLPSHFTNVVSLNHITLATSPMLHKAVFSRKMLNSTGVVPIAEPRGESSTVLDQNKSAQNIHFPFVRKRTSWHFLWKYPSLFSDFKAISTLKTDFHKSLRKANVHPIFSAVYSLKSMRIFL